MISFSLNKIVVAVLPPDYKSLPRDKKVEVLVLEVANMNTNIDFLLHELKKYGDAVIPDLQALLDKYGMMGNDNVVITIIRVLGYYPSETSIDPLMAQVYRNKEHAMIIFSAITSIERRTKSEKAYKAMLKIYLDYPQGLDWMTDDIVKDADDSRIPYLIQLLNDADFSRSDLVIDRLAKVSEDKYPLVLPAIEGQLKSRDELDRSKAAEALANMGAKGSIATLKNAMQIEEEIVVKVNMTSALVSLGDFLSAGYLVDLMGSRYDNLRQWARDALVEISEQDFGDDQAAWRAWFEDEKKKRGL